MIDFIFGRLFFVDMLVIGFILTARFPRRDGWRWRTPIAIAACLVVSVPWNWIFGTQSGGIELIRLFWSSANYLSAILVILATLAFCVRINGWAIGYVGAMMWFVQQIANSLDFSMHLSLGKSAAGFLVHMVIVGGCAFAVYLWFAARLDVQILDRLPLKTVMPVWLLMCLACLELNSYASDLDQTNTSYYMAIILLDIMGLLYQKSLYQFVGLERVNEITQMMMEQGRKQYEISKESITQVNIKCHDLRHQIRHFRKEGQIAESVLQSMEQAVNDYDSAVRTGNPALNVILTEKSLICRSRGIGFTCMAEGIGLGYMEETDMYALFGNALENAIEATEALQDPEQKHISFTMHRVGSFYSIHIQNYADRLLQLENGLPVTSKTDKVNHGYGVRSMQMLVEKYDGELSFQQNRDVVNLYLLLPCRIEETGTDKAAI